MAKSYKGVRLKEHRVYTVRQLEAAYNVHENTVSNWVRAGLIPSVRGKPYLFRGLDVNAFHKERRSRSKHNLKPNEFKCTGCKMVVLPVADSVSNRLTNSGAYLCTAVCGECGASVHRIVSTQDIGAFMSIDTHSTSEGLSHEVRGLPPAGIVKSEGQNKEVKQHPSGSTGTHRHHRAGANDRIIHKWQGYARRYDEKTIDRHIAAIRSFESTLNGKGFDKLTIDDVCMFRDVMKASLLGDSGSAPKAKSTVAHILSHVRDFLRYLLKQEKFVHLPEDLADYLVLPKSVYAKSLPKQQRDYPTLVEAEGLLTAMPSGSLMEERDRAIFAIAFLGALRADTLVSLGRRHLDIENRRIIQDANVVRAKNGKSLVIAWFPIPEAFGYVAVNWAERLEATGLSPDDPLFPSCATLKFLIGSRRATLGNVESLRSKYPVSKAFEIACRNQEVKYTPHSVKHTIAAERDVRQLTSLERKAWSQNMGHDHEITTATHYGKLADNLCIEVIEGISDNRKPSLINLPDSSKVALFDEMIEKIERQEGLVSRRS